MNHTAAADRLLEESGADAWAQISPSPYENGRIAAVAPWLDGHPARLRHLCARQAPDGGWGVAGFRLVPTLSATEALLTACARRGPGDVAVPAETMARAAARGIETLRRWLPAGSAEATRLPDTVAIELVVPRLVTLINEHLARHAADPIPHLGEQAGAGPLRPPRGTDPALLDRLRQATAARHVLPPKLWHAWEILSPGVPRAPEVRPVEGSVGCSPAATAAWVGAPPDPAAPDPASRFLDALQRHRGGLLPLGSPMPFFERAWILSVFAGHGVPHTAPPGVLDSLDGALGADGMSAGYGLPVDADDTAVALYALARNGRGRRPDSLMTYHRGDHFCTYADERTASPSANAHAVDALGYWLAAHPEDRERYGPALRGAADWLVDAQDAEGGWTDKWHGSPYYATATCAKALHAYGGPRCRPAVDRAVGWMLATRHADGRWGHGEGTVEETAYAVWTLLLSREPERAAAVGQALAGARDTLAAGAVSEESTPLWIGKDVYTPVRIVRATVLAARHDLRTGGTAGRPAAAAAVRAR